MAEDRGPDRTERTAPGTGGCPTFGPVFATFFRLGWHHLTDVGAWDHQLFLLTIALAYQPALWRRWVALATVFALGHTAALALAAGGLVPSGVTWVEPAIAGSIVALALVDLGFLLSDPYGLRFRKTRDVLTGALVLGFGVVHGLGFAGGFAAAAAGSSGGALAGMLAAFALGVEAAQLLMLFGAWVVGYLLLEMMQLRPLAIRRWALVAVALAGAWVLVGRGG